MARGKGSFFSHVVERDKRQRKGTEAHPDPGPDLTEGGRDSCPVGWLLFICGDLKRSTHRVTDSLGESVHLSCDVLS